MQDSNARFPTIAKILILRQFLWGAAFYGAFVLLTKFFLNDLNYSESDTIMMMGAFGAVGPVFSAVGGFLADKFIGAFRAVYIGYATYLVGFLLLGIGASQLNIPMSILSIALIGFARGLSATCPTVLFGNSYSETNRESFQQGLTVNYSINNLGSFSAKYLFPFLITYLAYQGVFFVSAILMGLNLLMFYKYRKELASVGNDLDKAPLSIKTWALFFAGSAAMLGLIFWIFSNLDAGKYILYALGFGAIGYFIYEITKATRAFQYKMVAVLITVCILIVFYFFYGQMFTSMNMYAINLMDDTLLGFIPIHPESNMAFNPLWCFVLGGPMIQLYSWLDRKGYSPTIPTKIAGAFMLTTIAFTLLGLSAGSMDADGKISANWILSVHFFQSGAELIVGALGAGFIFEMVPRYLAAFSIGLRAVAISLSGILAAVIATKIALPKDIVFTPEVVETVYTSYFYMLAQVAAFMAILTLGLSKVIQRLIARGEALEAEEKIEVTMKPESQS
ncbi:peptide MFS transporter [Aliivibrio sp. S3MY1]|uniref:peptide MFS transporter n=1 Tax=unclassified Aliivibrio TaxID=2645654 RepID=UPI002379E573|nr:MULTISPECIES: peptide MFS transporter [unclassified Aliivibrio]MDD9194541.1 peptide MFS transporter [Aliivibrio sp. S3MY1]MDD9198120.1 peptide MFS transporter [Aliivibrio sp. S2MY1]